MPTVLKSGSLSLLEPSWPVQACNGLALPLPLFLIMPPPSLYILPTPAIEDEVKGTKIELVY